MTSVPRPGRRRRQTGLVVLVLAAAAIVVATLLLVGGRLGLPGPTSPPIAVVEPDKAPLALDGQVDDAGLFHDSRDDLYRSPIGPVTAGTDVTLRLRATAGDLTAATLKVTDTKDGGGFVVPMHVVATDATAGSHGYDYWEATIGTLPQPTVLTYVIVAQDGAATRYVFDDAADGGPGTAGPRLPDDSGWQITAYDPSFTTPDWARGAVVYQIFPDRFANGDPANDPSPTATQGTNGAALYRYGDVYGNPVLKKAWSDLPEGYCRAYEATTCSEGPLGRDFYGGDLAGITEKLGYLADLGVTVLYLNPIFAAPSNHRYDTTDYMTIDPDLGTQADFDALVAAAKAKGIHVILDGVFNHVSSDSPWFDRSHRFSTVGACESAASPYRSWFTFRAPTGSEPSPCAPSTPGGTDTYYAGWAGFDTIPELQETPEVLSLINGTDGVVRHWIADGTGGWRLDVLDNLSDPLVKQLRVAAKAADPDSLIIGEQWGNSSHWLLGNEVDSVMNYRFRRAVISLVNGATADLSGALNALSPSQFASAMLSVREDYPPAAVDALLNLVDSHDTTRILWTLTPAAENATAKADPSALAEGKAKLRIVAALQLTWPGMAGLYYGDEVGLTGQSDPDDRRTYPWSSEDTQLRDWYATLAHLRAAHPSLHDGDLRFLLSDDKSDTLAYARRTDSEASIVALNLATSVQTVSLDVAGLVPDGTVLVDGLGGRGATVSGGKIAIDLDPRGAAILTTPAGTDLTPPPAPAAPTATAAPSRVELAWTPAAGAARYRIWRSLVSGGGFQAIGESTSVSFADRTARNGTTYYYAISAVDAAGNVSARSGEVTALPRLTVADALLDVPATLSGPLSATTGTPLAALVTVPGTTEVEGPTVGLRLEAGLGPKGSDPATNPGWSWSAMHFEADVKGADRYVGEVRPEAAGDVAVAVRLTTGGPDAWQLLDRDGLANGFQPAQLGTLTAVQGSDREAPPAPGAPTATTASGSSITLTWPPVTAPDLYRYEVWRADTPGGTYERLGPATDPTFTDETVSAGAAYVYVVTAEDTSFNRSGYSAEAAVAAETREVQVTFNVTLPAGTPAGDMIYIAGDFQGWNPAGTPMARVDASTWTITLPFIEGKPPQYKYTRGSWDAVEKDAGCGEIPNRTILITYGTDGTQAVADTVAKWRDLGHCG